MSASDAENPSDGCELRVALKCQPGTFPDTETWRPNKKNRPFTLGPVIDVIKAVHVELERGVDLTEAISNAKAILAAEHAGLRTFLEHATDTYFDYHDAREQQLGHLKLLDTWTVIEKIPNRSSVAVWAPIYEASDGSREVRRLRHGSAQSRDTVWPVFASHVAAEAPGSRPAERIFVVELGLLDGTSQVLVNGITAADAETLFDTRGRPAARSASFGTERTPCSGCSDCKLTAACPSLVAVPNLLQRSGRGRWTRSVSAHDLNVYAQCPSRWFMERESHLPREVDGSESQLRGTAVHRWLEAAHRRSVRCRTEDIPSLDSGHLGLAAGLLDGQEYELAFPYLLQHLDHCPFAEAEMTSLTTEETLFGYDAAADVVAVSKPDATFLRSGELIVREYKTTEGHLPLDADQARERFGAAIPWLLLYLDSGFASRHHASAGVVELEILTPSGARVFTYRTDDEILMRIARVRVEALTEEWHQDGQWLTKPSPSCAFCPVRRWCPDRDAYQSPAGMSSPSNGGVEDFDAPPF